MSRAEFVLVEHFEPNMDRCVAGLAAILGITLGPAPKIEPIVAAIPPGGRSVQATRRRASGGTATLRPRKATAEPNTSPARIRAPRPRTATQAAQEPLTS